jgi:hypothetical protein
MAIINLKEGPMSLVRRMLICRLKWLWLALGLAMALLGFLFVWVNGAVRAAVPTPPASYDSGRFFFPPYPSNADRMGVGGPIGSYTTSLSAGWYVDWSSNANSPHPGGIEFAQTIAFNINTGSAGCGGANRIAASQRSQVTASISNADLINDLRANPGALWFIGNEPDAPLNTSPITPQLYAQLYHEYYTLIQTYDPTARVAIGAVVQPSPLRLAYLDSVRAYYLAAYGVPLPTALWNIHLYALPEVACSGASFPPGASGTAGWSYNWAQSVDLNILKQNVRAMRQWMFNRGESNKPLIVTEFGELIPDDGSYWLNGLHFTPQVTRDYLNGTINYFLTGTDATIGYHADGNRLVQMWAWYSLTDASFGGRLLNPNGSFTLAGTAFAAIANQNKTLYSDLYPVPVTVPTGSVDASGETTFSVQINNHGNMWAQLVPGRFALYGDGSGIPLATQVLTAGQVLTRYAGIQPVVSAQWTITIQPATPYTFTFELDPGHTINQIRRSDQILTYTLAPDLAVTTMAVGGPSEFLWVKSVTATVTATVANLGFLTSTSSSTLQFITATVGGPSYSVGVVPISPLAPNASVNTTGVVTFPKAGFYTVTAQLIPGGLDLLANDDTQTLNVWAYASRFYLPIMRR